MKRTGWLGILCLGLVGWLANGQDNLLGTWNFVTEQGHGLAVQVTPEGEYKVEDHDGIRLLRIMPTSTAPVVIREGQQEPAFPHVNPEKAAEKPEIRVNLTLTDKAAQGIDPKEPVSVMLVLDLYDVAYSGTFGARHFIVYSHGTPPRGGIVNGVVSGSDYGKMPLTRTHLRDRTYLIEDVWLDGRARGAPGADISIKVESHLLLRAVSVYRADMDLNAAFEKRWRAINELQIPMLRKRALVEDRADQARQMVQYLETADAGSRRLRRDVDRMAAARAAILAAVEVLETAGDELYFKGRAAVARGDANTIASRADDVVHRIRAVDAQLTALDALAEDTAARAMRAARGEDDNWWFAPIRTSPPPMPFVGGKINPVERIIFCGADGGYAYEPNWKLPYARTVGVNFRHLWYMYPDLNEDLVTFAAHRNDDTRQAAFDQEYMVGLGTGVLTYRHTYIIPTPAWFTKKADEGQDIWTYNGAGELKNRLNGFNDEVRKLFVDYHREIARRHRYTRRWNLPLLGAEAMQFYAAGGGCENGYSPSAVAKFRLYLQALYGDVAKLNAAVGTDYADFAAIEPPADMGMQLRRRPGPLDYHFERFRRQCQVDLYDLCAKTMKAESPDTQTWLETMARFDLTAPHAIDTYNLFRVADVSATHSQGEFNPIWNMSVHRYWPGSIYGKQESFPSENEAHCDPDIEMLRAAIHAGWTLELICGDRGLGLWSEPKAYRRSVETYGPYLYDGRYDGVPYRNLGAGAVFRKRADSWLPLLNTLRWQDPEVGMLYSTTTQIVGWPYQETEFEGLNLHQWLFYQAITYFVVHEDAIADTRETLADYRVIIAPYAPLTQREIGREYVNWLRVGGTLLASGPFGVYDQFGKEDLTVLRTVFGEGLKVEYAADEIAGDGRNRLDAASVAYLRQQGILDVDSVAGWFWNVTAADLPASARVLLRLEDGRPVLLEGEYEGGRVMFSACPVFANQLGSLYVNQVRRRVVTFARPTRPYGLLTFPLTDAVEHLYLAVVNYNYYHPVRDTITLDAAVRRVVDVSIEHGFPVPVKRTETATAIDLELPPGRCALLDLGYRADMTWPVRQINADQGVPPSPAADVYSAELARLAASQLPPNARREAWALMALARRWASRGILDRAAEYRAAALAVDAEPSFKSFDGERVHARRVATPIVVDGKLDDWANAASYALKGTAVSGGAFQAAYDDQYLYLAVAVRDGEVKDFGEQGVGVNWLYGCDGVEVALNPSDTAGKVPIAMVDGLVHDGYSYTTFAVSGRMRALPFNVLAPAHARTATQRLADGYVMELAIPLADYCILPARGASIGFDLALCGATGSFGRYAKREGRIFDGKRLARLYFD